LCELVTIRVREISFKLWIVTHWKKLERGVKGKMLDLYKIQSSETILKDKLCKFGNRIL
jgi:hypothetical protein